MKKSFSMLALLVSLVFGFDEFGQKPMENFNAATVAVGANSEDKSSFILEFTSVPLKTAFLWEFSKDELFSLQTFMPAKSFSFSEDDLVGVGFNIGYLKYKKEWPYLNSYKPLRVWQSATVGGFGVTYTKAIVPNLYLFSRIFIDGSFADSTDSLLDGQLAFGFGNGFVGGVNFRSIDIFTPRKQDITTYFIGYSFSF